MSAAIFFRELPSLVSWIFAAVFLISQIGIALMLGHKVGKDLIKIQLSFTTNRFTNIVNTWTSEDLKRFKKHFTLDFIHPFWYAILLALLLANTAPRNGSYFMIWLPIIAGLCDAIENFIHYSNISNFKQMKQPWIALSAFFASSKWLLVVISIAVLTAWSLSK